MPCSSRAASRPRVRRFASPTLSPPKIVAAFDLSDGIECEVRALIERFHRGRWPLFRCYAMRRVGSAVYEVVQWNPIGRAHRSPAYSVVTWDLTAIGLRWRDYPTLDAARTAFAAIVRSTPLIGCAPAAAIAGQ